MEGRVPLTFFASRALPRNPSCLPPPTVFAVRLCVGPVHWTMISLSSTSCILCISVVYLLCMHQPMLDLLATCLCEIPNRLLKLICSVFV